eukprot:2789354-Prymnesium_polylepis.1
MRQAQQSATNASMQPCHQSALMRLSIEKLSHIGHATGSCIARTRGVRVSTVQPTASGMRSRTARHGTSAMHARMLPSHQITSEPRAISSAAARA